ncbi:MAG TPA: hypothetical protein VFY11_11970 [Nocardioidaceae bacterium]|jgi:hypothetical protein|nr:hypothetical protein [Nocardioidaceae bacterium]
MRYPIRRLLAVVAAAILCLSPIAFATAVNADVAVDVGYARDGGVQMDDEVDIGRARDEIVVPAPDIGRARNEVVVPAPDIGRARNEIVVPEQTPAPSVPADTGIDAETWTVVALSGVIVVAVVGSVLFTRRRHHHGGHLAHPA